MAANILDECKEVLGEDESAADKVYVMKTIERGMQAHGQRRMQANHILRLMRRGRGCRRLDECYNPRVLADRGDLEWWSAMIVSFVEIDIILGEQ